MEPIAIYTLDQRKPDILRARGDGRPVDPIVRREFGLGDRVVFCGACECPHLLDSWRAAGERCGSVCASPTTKRYPDFEGRPRPRPRVTRIVVQPRALQPRPIIPVGHRIARALMAAGILVAVAFFGSRLWSGFNSYLHSLHAPTFMDLIYNLVALAVYVAFTFACLVAGIFLGIGMIFVFVNLFAGPQSYEDPVHALRDLILSFFHGSHR